MALHNARLDHVAYKLAAEWVAVLPLDF